MNRMIAGLLALSASIFLSGCGKETLTKAQYAPDKIAAAAMAKLDANKDGKIDASEMKKCPALVRSLAEIDKNNDKAIDAAELTERFEIYRSIGSGFRPIAVQVFRLGRPAEGVSVTLEPESFFSDLILPSVGVSDKNGFAQMRTVGQDSPGTYVGMYRVVLSKKDAAGKETLAVKYNSDSAFGWEIAASNRLHIAIDMDH